MTVPSAKLSLAIQWVHIHSSIQHASVSEHVLLLLWLKPNSRLRTVSLFQSLFTEAGFGELLLKNLFLKTSIKHHMDKHFSHLLFSHLQKLLLAYPQMPMRVDPWISPLNFEVSHIRWYSSPWWSNAYLVTPFRWRFFILSTTEVLLTIDFYWNLFCKQDNWWKWNSTPTCSLPTLECQLYDTHIITDSSDI